MQIFNDHSFYVIEDTANRFDYYSIWNQRIEYIFLISFSNWNLLSFHWIFYYSFTINDFIEWFWFVLDLWVKFGACVYRFISALEIASQSTIGQRANFESICISIIRLFLYFFVSFVEITVKACDLLLKHLLLHAILLLPHFSQL